MRTDVLWVGVVTVCAVILIHPARSGAGWAPSGCAPVVIGGPPVQPYYQVPPAQPSRPGLLPQRRQQASTTNTKQTSGATGRVRLQSDESSTAPPLRMPSPEQLGVGPKARATDVDWTAVRKRMEALTVGSFHLQKVEGGFRFTCVVPIANDRIKIEADGLTEAEAIDLALMRAESRRGGWDSGKIFVDFKLIYF